MPALGKRSIQRIPFAIFVIAVLFSRHAGAQDATDYSGVWKMDASRSDSAHQAVPIGPVTLVIQQNPSNISIETRRVQKQKPTLAVERLTYELDGTEKSVAGSSGTAIKVKARREGSKLVTETTRIIDGSTVTTMHVYSLDAGGKELSIDKTLTIQHGYQSFEGAANTGRGKDVFVKSSEAVKN